MVLSCHMQRTLLALVVSHCACAFVPLLSRSQPHPECSACQLSSAHRGGSRGVVVKAQLSEGPNDELKVRFNRGDDETRTSFLPKEPARSVAVEAVKPAPATGSNEQLREEIRALMPEEIPPAPEKPPIDLNGIKPTDLLIGATAYGVTCWASWQFTNVAGQFFADNPMDTAFYVVARITSLARVIVVGMGALGAGVTGIAAVGQLALAVQISIGIAKGEIDPNAPRTLPNGERKIGELERMFKLMQGGGKRVQ